MNTLKGSKISEGGEKSSSDPIVGFMEAVGDVLLAQRGALKEFELIQLLQAPPYSVIDKKALRSELSLFRTHFLLFHALYRLRDQWREEGLFDLHIDALHIQLKPLQDSRSSATTGIERDDKLRRYYLNWDEFTSTTEADVTELLNSFWQGIAGVPSISEAQQKAALDVLKLEAMPESRSVLRRHYLQMVHRCHPDKGGSSEQVEQVIQAYQVLAQQLT